MKSLIPFFVLQICCISFASSRLWFGRHKLSRPYHPYPRRRHQSVCPSLRETLVPNKKKSTLSVHRVKPGKKTQSGWRSARRTTGTARQYRIGRKRQFLRIGVPRSGWSARKMGRPETEGSICIGSSCYRPPPQGSKCLGVDLTFIMDCSGSINSREWKQLSKFVKDTSAIFDVHPDSTRVAAINFGSRACMQFNLRTHHTNTQLYSAIDKIPKCGGTTHLAEAMDLAVERIHRSSYDRPNVLDLCLVFTDGQANGPGNVGNAADSLRRAGCEVYAIGIGDGINDEQLLSIAGGSEGKVVLAKDFQKLLKNRVFCQSLNSIENS